MRRFVLRTNRLVLRPIRLGDLAAVYDCHRQDAVAVNAGFPSPRSIEDSRAYVASRVDAWKTVPPPVLTFSILTKAGAWAGALSLRWAHPGLGELVYSLHPEFWGRGYAPEAAAALSDWAFRQGAHRVQATCWTENKRSAAVLRKIGLRREGRLRGYLRRGDWVRDEHMWGMTRPDWERARIGA